MSRASGRIRVLKRFVPVVLGVLLAFIAASAAFERWVADTKIPPLVLASSVTIEDRNGKLLRAFTVADGRWRLRVRQGDVDPRYISFLLAYEDKRFYQHDGVDPWAVLRAAWQVLRNRRIVSGGSTLTMQVARLLEDSGTGRWRPKLRQIRLALALERRISKRDILNLYLELAPFGGNIEGVRAASLTYFGKEPRRLTAAQSALLVALPQSPETRRPDRFPDRAARARDRVLARLTRAGVLPVEAARAATREVVTAKRKPFPSLAPHLSERARAQRPLALVQRLTIDRHLQATLENLAANYVIGKPGGLSAAIMVMDHQNGEILASVGSAGYLDVARRGFIDMTQAIRSPGSALKPLIYGLAFDAGIAHPETLLEDRPTAFGSYAPQNFDKQYYGTISARNALRYSLNIPAVALLEAVGPAKMLARMRRAGVSARLPSNKPPGLAIALGGLGVSLQDLVTLYAAIARGGIPVTASYRLGHQASTAPRQPVMSAVAAWEIGDILTGVKGPWLAPDNNLAYKTGTSYGYRDAWAIGFDGAHVIGVWLGRPDGASVAGVVGAKLAAPLLFEAFGRLKSKLVPLAAPPPATLIVSNAELPQHLRRLRRANTPFGAPENKPEIAFPPDGALVDLGLAQGQDQAVPLVVKVRNGTPPYTWIANGVPFLISTRERQVEWSPTGPGYLDISVIDAKGLSQKARIRVK